MASDGFMTFPPEIFHIIISKGAGSGSDEERRAFLRQMSVVSKDMTSKAQSHLFSEGAITFCGNGTGKLDNKGKHGYGYNDWCKSKVVATHHAGTIKYTRPFSDSGNSVHPLFRECEYLDVFTKVTKLEMSYYASFVDPAKTPMFGTVLGHKIKSLVLTRCGIKIDEFVEFLCLFNKLQYLRISDPIIDDRAREGPVRSPPHGTFSEVLHLHFSGLTFPTEILQMFHDISFKMNYSRIVLDDEGVFYAEENLSPFLSKFKGTLKYLRFHSESSPSYRVHATMTTRRLIVI